jgi:hypothetical protein
MSESNYSYITSVSKAGFLDDIADSCDRYSPAGYEKQASTYGVLLETLVNLWLAARLYIAEE